MVEVQQIINIFLKKKNLHKPINNNYLIQRNQMNKKS